MYANNTVLIAQLNDLSRQIPFADKINKTISAESVGWHIDHSLLVIQKIITSLEQSNPANYTVEFNFKRFLVFSLNNIPRGKARAPKLVMPTQAFDAAATQQVIESIKLSIQQLTLLPANAYFPHPYFGNLNLRRSRKMLWLHTKHHLKIIGDIIGNG